MYGYSLIATGQEITHLADAPQVYGTKAVALCGRKVYMANHKPRAGRVCLTCESVAAAEPGGAAPVSKEAPMTKAQVAALVIIDRNGSSYVGAETNEITNTVHHRTAAALVTAGTCEWVLGCDGRFVRRASPKSALA